MIQINRWIGILFFILILTGCNSGKNSSERNNKIEGDSTLSIVGKTLPAWQEGYLDIHAINTGRGESTLLILPDGTTMLVDAAGSLISSTHAFPPPPQKPNSSVSPGEAIINYTRHFIKPANPKLNYLMISHFHSDHMGGYSDSLPMDSSGSFRMSGITEVGAKIKFDKILDRGYPDYNYPTDITSTPVISNYIKFINWSKAAYGSKAEQFLPGRNDQITLRQNPSAYSNFEIRNLVSNGKVWTGKGMESRNTFPPVEELVAAKADENFFSIGFMMSYGKFNYFTAGDLQYAEARTEYDKYTYPWKNVEAQLVDVVTPVDVMKANHHGTSNCNGEELLEKLIPQVVLSHTWRDVHPNPETVARMYAANSTCQIFTTNMSEENKIRIGRNLAKIKSMQGHIVVRVDPGGENYNIYVLDDSNQNYIVSDVFGPYQSN